MADQMKVENGKGIEQETHETATPHEVVTLETLPNEIISSIAVEMLVDIEVPCVDFRTRRDHEDYNRDEFLARQDLTSFCMASKRIAPSAQKALYRNILIADVDTLILLYRTFLRNPKLGIYVNRMSFNIYHKCRYSEYLPDDGFESDPIDLRPLLSCTQHGLGEHLTAVGSGSEVTGLEIVLEMLYTLQFRVLNCTTNLRSLDLNVHPQLFENPPILIDDLYDGYMDAAYAAPVSRVLCSQWKYALPSLLRLKRLQLIGNERSFRTGERSDFVASICKRFLTLPKLEQLVWFDHAEGWFDTFAPSTMHGKSYVLCSFPAQGSHLFSNI